MWTCLWKVQHRSTLSEVFSIGALYAAPYAAPDGAPCKQNSHLASSCPRPSSPPRACPLPVVLQEHKQARTALPCSTLPPSMCHPAAPPDAESSKDAVSFSPVEAKAEILSNSSSSLAPSSPASHPTPPHLGLARLLPSLEEHGGRLWGGDGNPLKGLGLQHLGQLLPA